jgi:hypothetical protein
VLIVFESVYWRRYDIIKDDLSIFFLAAFSFSTSPFSPSILLFIYFFFSFMVTATTVALQKVWLEDENEQLCGCACRFVGSNPAISFV